MRRLLALIILATLSVGVNAGRMKGKVVSSTDRKPVANATLKVEYVDSIITYETDRKGRFNIEPLSFPITVTARGVGMLDATVGIMSMPESKLILELAPDGAFSGSYRARKPDWSTARKRRLRSTYIERTPLR